MKNSRRRANPFESISKGIFINRAAMKMANLDAILDWMFTNPVDLNGVSFTFLIYSKYLENIKFCIVSYCILLSQKYIIIIITIKIINFTIGVFYFSH